MDEFRLDFDGIFDEYYEIVFNEIVRATGSIEFASSSTVEIFTKIKHRRDGSTMHHIISLVALAIKMYDSSASKNPEKKKDYSTSLNSQLLRALSRASS